MLGWLLLLPVLARAASHDMAAAFVKEDPNAECRADCKKVHRRLHAQTLCANGRGTSKPKNARRPPTAVWWRSTGA